MLEELVVSQPPIKTSKWSIHRIQRVEELDLTHISSNWVNNIQPIFIGAKHYTLQKERLAILSHLNQIEVATGWDTTLQAKELQSSWKMK